MRRINTILVANRGEIARRIARTCKDLGYGAVAVYSEADADLPFVREADRAVCIGPAPSAESYLDVAAIIGAAKRAGADAIHPGYGFLSESQDLAAAAAAADLVWIGPPAEAIAAMADKSSARQLVSKRDVPTVPGYDGDAQDDETLAAQAARVGFPVLVKAAAGGGGRGMRRVDEPSELRDALSSARREAESAFGNGRLLLERYLERPRHIEVQVLADAHGNVVHLGERECSIQRRHQKIIEEAPSVAVDAGLRERLGAAAVEVARAVGYQNAGTVEFLLDPAGAFYFLEMNTRLQVEHPVTEMVTGLDLVALQIAVAEGAPLPFTQEQVTLSGHAIEARLYAEDPSRDYLPSSGTLLRFDVPCGDGLRLDAGYETGDTVGVHYDPMLAKLIAFGPDRATATRRMARALRQSWVPGVATNLPLLREIFDHEGWAKGDLDTHFLPRHGLPTAPPLNLERGALAATVIASALRRRHGVWPEQVEPGWRVDGPVLSRDRWHSLGEEAGVSWRVLSDAALDVSVEAGESTHAHRVRVLAFGPERVRAEVDGVVQHWRFVHRRHDGRPGRGRVEAGDNLYLHFGDGEAVVALQSRYPLPQALADEPGTCSAPMPGKVVKLNVAVGDRVSKGQTLLVLEAMKMEHAVSAPEDGEVVQLRVSEGESVDQGMILIRLE